MASYRGESFHKEMAEKATHKKLIEQVLQASLGVSLTVEMVMDNETPETDQQTKDKNPTNSHAEDPLVKSALEIFGGRIIRVHEANSPEDQVEKPDE